VAGSTSGGVERGRRPGAGLRSRNADCPTCTLPACAPGGLAPPLPSAAGLPAACACLAAGSGGSGRVGERAGGRVGVRRRRRCPGNFCCQRRKLACAVASGAATALVRPAPALGRVGGALEICIADQSTPTPPGSPLRPVETDWWVRAENKRREREGRLTLSSGTLPRLEVIARLLRVQPAAAKLGLLDILPAAAGAVPDTSLRQQWQASGAPTRGF